jgi:pimeloyl-ACP methyl ester carboxylesterase
MRDHTERSPEMLRLSVGELTIAALAWGPADGPLALCLHGYPDTAWTWRHLGPSLASRGWRVVAPYLRGYAPSDLAPDGCYALGVLVRDVHQLHARLSGDRSAVLIGHDWGAAVAYIVAGDGDTFRRIVTLAVPPPRAVLLALRHPLRLPVLLALAVRQTQATTHARTWPRYGPPWAPPSEGRQRWATTVGCFSPGSGARRMRGESPGCCARHAFPSSTSTALATAA